MDEAKTAAKQKAKTPKNQKIDDFQVPPQVPAKSPEKTPKVTPAPIEIGSTKPSPTPKPTTDHSENPQNTEKAKKSRPDKSQKAKKPHTALKVIIFIVIILAFLGIISAIWIIGWLVSQQPNNPTVDRVDFPDPIYSLLTGEEISDAKLNQNPTYCVQIPNGLDGARPQAGLNQAGIIFEAIAEADITRFAAIFQNSTVSAIGPIRSLRPYYLDWDTPFDCTVVHAGGSDEAIAALRQGNYRDLNENYSYMWRESSNRGWNNLFTSSTNLNTFNLDQGYTTSNPKTFPHLTPDEVDQILSQKRQSNQPTDCDSDSTDCKTVIPIISNININFGISPLFNTSYFYDSATNKYYRYFATGDQHFTYDCPADLYQPNTLTDCGDPVPVSPSVVIAMVVNQSPMADNYHENIRTIGSGTATIFQNGEVIEGSWTKSSVDEQIVFRDATGNIVKLSPGQTWISAIPQYGSVSYETVNLEIENAS